MSNVPELAARRDKRAGKEECFEVVRKLSGGGAVQDKDLAALYSFFLPVKVRKPTCVFGWAAGVCDSRANYAFCRFVQSANGMLVAANTSSAHIVFSDEGREPGFYDVSGGYAGDDVAVMPDVMSAMGAAQGDYASDAFDVESLRVAELPSGLAYVLPWDGRAIDKKALDASMSGLSRVRVHAKLGGAVSFYGMFGEVSVCAVHMPSDEVAV